MTVDRTSDSASPALDRLATARAALSRTVLAALKGTTPEPLATPRRAVLEEQAGAGEPDAQHTLALLRRLENVPRRVARALSTERVDVVLADGSKLALDDAERLLANKEEQGVHTTLRRSVDSALAPFRQFQRHGSDAATREQAKAFVVETAPLRDAACEALGSLGGSQLEDELSLAWALDMPDPQGAFGDDATRALVNGLRDAVRTPPAAFRAPRAMAGVALDGRYAWPASLRRADRHLRTLEAAGIATAWRRNTDAGVGVACALALASAPSRQASGLERRSAERAARISAAVVVLRARASVAMAALDEDAHEDEAREAVIHALGLDPGRTLLAQLAVPSWASVDDDTARAFIRAPAYALALRDSFDETWLRRSEAWDAIEHGDVVRSVDAEATEAIAVDAASTINASQPSSDPRASRAPRSPSSDPRAPSNDASREEPGRPRAKPRASHWAQAWRTWAGEWL